jgi:hypothetical protein
MKHLIGSLLLIALAANCQAQTSQPTLPGRYHSFLFGVAYYPEQESIPKRGLTEISDS